MGEESATDVHRHHQHYQPCAQQHDHPVHYIADTVSGGCTINSSVFESLLRVAPGCTLHPIIIWSTRPAFALPLAPHISAPPSTCTTDVVGQTQSTCSGFYKVEICQVPLNRRRLRDDEELAYQVIELRGLQVLSNWPHNQRSPHNDVCLFILLIFLLVPFYLRNYHEKS